jgi:hypothetical protein
MPGNITEWYTYDQASRRTHRHATMPGWLDKPAGYLRADTISYDQRNKLLNGHGRVTGEHVGENYAYDGLGHLVSSFRNPNPLFENWVVDALGNHRFSESAYGEIRRLQYTTEPGTGRLRVRMTPTGADTAVAADTTTYYYDDAGNRTSMQERSKTQPHPQPIYGRLQRVVEGLSMYRGDG